MRGNSLAGLFRVLLVVAGCSASVAAAAQPAVSPSNALPPWHVPNPDALPDNQQGREVRLGRDLIARTSVLIGPDAPDPGQRYTGNGLDCESCHINAGTKRYGLPLAGIWPFYPAFSARLGKIETLTERINDCMQRSMNGRPLPPDGPEMTAMLTFLKFIGGAEQAQALTHGRAVPRLALLDRAADPQHGREVYGAMCAVCHQPNGGGVRAASAGSTAPRKRYLFPPLWGRDSYNDGAGMGRNITAAWFVHANMPQGATFADPALSLGDAYDVAAYINQQPRPHKAHLEKDYPDRWLKPADAAFPPLLGPFGRLQHELGPWPPIIEWLKAHAPSAARPPFVD